MVLVKITLQKSTYVFFFLIVDGNDTMFISLWTIKTRIKEITLLMLNQNNSN